MTMNSSLNEQMSVDALLNELVVLNHSSADYAISRAISDDFMISKVAPKPANDLNTDCEKILNMTALSIKMFANSYYKKLPFLEPSDIDQIKESLNNYAKSDEKLKEFKKVIIEDLTAFQKQIKANHVQKLADLGRQKQLCERQIVALEFEKNKLIMDRLSKVVWPYDEKTKEYDAKIAALQLQVKKYNQKIEETQQMKPIANEKDILMYRMHLNEKYRRKQT